MVSKLYPPPPFPNPFQLMKVGGSGKASYQVFKRVGPDFQKGKGLTGSQLVEEVAGKEGGDIFQKGCSFYIKNIKEHFEIFSLMIKKVYEQK